MNCWLISSFNHDYMTSVLNSLCSLIAVLFFLNDNDLTGPIPSEVCALRSNANPPGKLVELQADCSFCNADPATNCCTARLACIWERGHWWENGEGGEIYTCFGWDWGDRTKLNSVCGAKIVVGVKCINIWLKCECSQDCYIWISWQVGSRVVVDLVHEHEYYT